MAALVGGTMSVSVRPRFIAAAIAVAASAAAPALTQGSATSPVLARLQKGLWQVRMLGAREVSPRMICLGDPGNFVQLHHPRHRCSRSVSASTSNSVTMNYECPGIASGLTTIRAETPRLVRIESQGIDEGVPFAFRAEARRVGTCR
jgi:hypothetical protein